jgi:hypothetical protein
MVFTHCGACYDGICGIQVHLFALISPLNPHKSPVWYTLHIILYLQKRKLRLREVIVGYKT